MNLSLTAIPMVSDRAKAVTLHSGKSHGEFTGVVWFIEGDIQGCFDNINHEKLIDI